MEPRGGSRPDDAAVTRHVDRQRLRIAPRRPGPGTQPVVAMEPDGDLRAAHFVGLHALQVLCASIARQSRPGLPALIAIDEEGGRVTRLGPPALALPAMRRIADLGDPSLLERAGRALRARASGRARAFRRKRAPPCAS